MERRARSRQQKPASRSGCSGLGRDEMNLAEFPLALLTRPGPRRT